MAPADDEAAAAAAQEVRKFAFTAFRHQFPFLKADALDQVLSELQDCALTSIKKQEKAMTKSRNAFSFFSIPIELRNRIYEDVLVEDTWQQEHTKSKFCIIVESASVTSHHKSRKPRRLRCDNVFYYPALLQVNKQMRRETIPIYFGQNTFLADLKLPSPVAPFVPRVQRWLKMLGPEQAKFIKKLILRFLDDSLFRIYELEWLFPDLSAGTSPEKVAAMLDLTGLGVQTDAFRLQYLSEGVWGLMELETDGTIVDVENNRD